MAASVAGVPEASTAATVMAAGAVTTGGVWSATVTIAVVLPVLPAASVAENVTVVSPTGNWAGALLVMTAMGPSTMSLAVAPARKATMAASVAGVPEALTAATVMSAGAVTTGGVWSATVTVAFVMVGEIAREVLKNSDEFRIDSADVPNPRVSSVTVAMIALSVAGRLSNTSNPIPCHSPAAVLLPGSGKKSQFGSTASIATLNISITLSS